MLTLRDFLLAIGSGGIALGPAIYALFEYAGWFKEIDPRWKRVAVASVAGALALGARALAAWLGYLPELSFGRTDIAEVFWNQVIMAAFAAFTSSTLIHGVLKLRASEETDAT